MVHSSLIASSVSETNFSDDFEKSRTKGLNKKKPETTHSFAGSFKASACTNYETCSDTRSKASSVQSL